jgi:hypothetical protein
MDPMSQSGQEGNGQADSEQTGQQGNNGTGTDSAQGTGNGGSSGADSAQQNSGNEAGNTTVSREEFDRLQRQLSAADQKRQSAETELQSLKDKDLSEKDKAVKDLRSITEERDSLLGEVNKLRLANAFLSANTIVWNDSEVALEIAHSKGYLADAVSDKGEVDSKELAKALEKLSKDKPFLVKSKDESEEDEEETPASGAPASGAGRKKQDDTARLDRLKSTLPALGRR